MFQAQAGYMVDKVTAALRAMGVPFHNPNRRKSGKWNPLARRKNSVRAADRVLAWMSDRQDYDTIGLWLPMIKADGVLKRGAKKANLSSDQDVFDLFASEEAMAGAFSRDVNWLRKNVLADYAKRIVYPIQVFGRYGAAGLREEPRLMIGTIHSFKGAEADSVFVCPDMSPGAYNQFQDEDPLPTQRLFYVAMTRTRDRLSLLQPTGRQHAGLI